MNKEIVSDAQGIALIVLFFVGSSSIFAQGLDAKQDLWVAFILGIIFVLPIVLISSRIHHIFPGKNLYDIMEIFLGKLLSKILITLYVFHFYFIAGDIFVNYGQFFRVVSLTGMPQIVFILCMGILCIWGIKEGVEVLSRFSLLLVSIPILILTTIVLLLLNHMDLNNFLPILAEGLNPVLKGGFSVFTFPLSQIVVFTIVFSNFRTKSSPYKIYSAGLFITALYLAILSITNISVIGINAATSVYYPSYFNISQITFGEQRIQILLAATFIFGGFIKIGILILCCCKGFAKLFEFKDYRFIVIPIALLIINLSYYQYPSVQYYFEFNADAWPAYTFVFHVIFPILLWICCEIKNYRHKIRPSTN